MLEPNGPTTIEEATAEQQRLRGYVEREDRLPPVRRVAGLDCGFEQEGAITRAAVAVLSYPELELVEQAIVRRPTSFPYVPGFLSFREAPAVLDALAQLHTPPDLLICDGQGLAHPRRFGLACHIGVLADLPSIGAAKSLLTGRHGALEPRHGATAPLLDRGEIVGVALCTRAGTRPLYVSLGHRISLASAVEWVLRCTPRYRLPETTRQAHRLASGPSPQQESSD
jgi:deoxyribonuclease V